MTLVDITQAVTVRSGTGWWPVATTAVGSPFEFASPALLLSVGASVLLGTSVLLVVIPMKEFLATTSRTAAVLGACLFATSYGFATQPAMVNLFALLSVGLASLLPVTVLITLARGLLSP
jgi:hypothetical protein